MSEPSPQPGLDRRAAWLTLVASWLVTAVLALWLVPWNWVPGGSLHPMSAQQLFTSAEISRAEHFAGLRRLLGWSSYGVSLLVALILGLTPLGARLVGRLTRGARWWVSVAGGVLALIVVGRLATLPFALLLRTQSVDYGLTNQGLAGWFADQGKGLTVSWVATTILVWVIVGAVRRSPRYWFAWAGAAAMVVTVVGSALYPVLVEPLFNKFTPMPDGPPRSAILRLADREGVHVNEVLRGDASRRTTTLDAYVSGLGHPAGRRLRHPAGKSIAGRGQGSRRPRTGTRQEPRRAPRHRPRRTRQCRGSGAARAAPGQQMVARARGGRRPDDPAVVALLMALVAVGSFAVSPLANSVSRAIEARADRGSLAATHDGKDFIAMQRRLAVEAVQDPTPPRWSQFWFGSHPTVLQRAGLPAALGIGER